jgi:phosphoribosylaminoimidazolecarboxamide formyltransferase/IMP cyclohydrolase
MSRAILSVSDKTGVTAFAAGLHDRGFELVSTGGTAAALRAAGLPVTSVSALTGLPEMLDGRVKTLHPAIHGGILARRDRSDDLEALRAHGIGPIDVVAVNLYPFARAASNPDTPFDRLIEEIDIGGPSLLRAAAKNFRDVWVLVDPADYAATLEALGADRTAGRTRRFELARKAFAHTAAYDATIAATLAEIGVIDGAFERPAPDASGLPALLTGRWERIRSLRYGENPHQLASWYGEPGAGGLGGATVVQGKELSFTNLLDLDAAARIVLEFAEPAAVVVKHTNPCGAATGATIAEAYVTAREADALSAFGGIVGVNRPVDEQTAKAITSTFIEAVVAPAVAPGAREILATRANLRVVLSDFAAFAEAPTLELRTVLGALLVQQRDRVAEAQTPWADEDAAAACGLRVVTRRPPTPEEWDGLRFAWRVCAHVKSNTVLFASSNRTLAIGAGQMSRVDAVNVAVMKAQAPLAGSVAASDAFFPFRDGLDAIARAGATAVVQPGGSVRDQEVIAAADEHGLAMVFTGRRHFRH